MSARKWPIYTMEVGDKFFIEQPPAGLRRKIYAHAADTGKKFSACRTDRFCVKSEMVITRIA